MNSDLNKMNDIPGILNVRYNSCKNDTVTTNFTILLFVLTQIFVT